MRTCDNHAGDSMGCRADHVYSLLMGANKFEIVLSTDHWLIWPHHNYIRLYIIHVHVCAGLAYVIFIAIARYYTCKLESIQLYAVLDGHNGSRACTFAQKHIPSLLLTCNMGENGEKAGEALKYTFENTEKHFFMMLDPSITRKMGLQMELQVC